MPELENQLYPYEENLLDSFSQNFDYHSSTYNDIFNTLVYTDICQGVPFIVNNQTAANICENFNEDILSKGLYSTVIKYFDYLRQLDHDFKESPRQLSDIVGFLNDPRLQTLQQMQDNYLIYVYQILVAQLEGDINNL